MEIVRNKKTIVRLSTYASKITFSISWTSRVNVWLFIKNILYLFIPSIASTSKWLIPLKGTQDWEFFWLRFWNLCYFFVRYVKILRFYKKIILTGPLLGEVRFFRVVLGLHGMKKNFELGPKKFFFLLQFWTLNMTQY